MDIDIDLGSGQFQKQQDHRIYRRRHDVAIGLGEPVLDKAIANQAAVHKNENRIPVQLLDLGLGDEAVNSHFTRIFRQ